jgi:anti-sigma regulatory factor (Ser/Thr protein kinase)
METTLTTTPRVRGSAPDAVLRLHVPAERHALEPARLAVLHFLEPWALDARALFNIELVLEETLLNASLHAFDGPGPHNVDLRVQVQPDAVVLQFEDEGRPFDPLQAAEPRRPASLADAQPGGLGLMLVRRLARAVEYRRIDGRNLLTITVARG